MTDGAVLLFNVHHKGSMVLDPKGLVDCMVGIRVLDLPRPVDRLVVGLVDLGDVEGVRFGVMLQPGMKGRNRDKHHGS